jgi:phospholipid transport system substrate-binding protein
MKALSFAAFILLILCQPIMAADGQAAAEFLKKNQDAVFAVLQQADITSAEKNKKIIEIITPLFDFALMAKLTLGKKVWPGLTKEQKERFTQLFIERLRSSYLDRLTLYTDEKVIYEAPVEVKRKVHIPTSLVSKDNKISILYKFYKSKTDWQIYDLEIQGVSIIRSYRAQFSQILQNESFDDLLQKMEKKTENE